LNKVVYISTLHVQSDGCCVCRFQPVYVLITAPRA